MGALSYAALGGLQGLGRGVEQLGRQQEQEYLLNERNQAAMDRLETRLTANGAGRAGKAPAVGALDVAANPEFLALASGSSREEIDDAKTMAAGKTPTREVTLSPERFANNPDRFDDATAAGTTAATVEKYTPGSAAALRMRAADALKNAMKVVDPSHSDDLSKSQQTDQTTGFLRRYSEGDARAGDAALVSQGKAAYNEDGRAATGEVGKGTVAESTVIKNKATAAEQGSLSSKHNAETGILKDKREGKIPIKEQIAAYGEERKQLASSRADLKAQESSLKDMKSTDAAPLRVQIKERRTELDRRDDELVAKMGDLSKRLTVVDEPSKKAAKTEAAPPAALLKDGVHTKFKNGQTWTLRGGVAVQVN